MPQCTSPSTIIKKQKRIEKQNQAWILGRDQSSNKHFPSTCLVPRTLQLNELLGLLSQSSCSRSWLRHWASQWSSGSKKLWEYSSGPSGSQADPQDDSEEGEKKAYNSGELAQFNKRTLVDSTRIARSPTKCNTPGWPLLLLRHPNPSCISYFMMQVSPKRKLHFLWKKDHSFVLFFYWQFWVWT